MFQRLTSQFYTLCISANEKAETLVLRPNNQWFDYSIGNRNK